MKRRRLRGGAVLAGVALAASLLTACGGGGSGSSASGGTVDLSFWNGLTGPDKAAVNQVIAGFNASHPKIKVTSSPTPWDVLYSKLLPAFSAGKGPDLVGISSDQLPGYADKHVLQPIDSLLTGGDIDKSTIVPSALSAGAYQGKQYGLPIEATPLMLYYNKKEFAAAGITKAPATWAEWVADAKKLTLPGGLNGQPKQYGMAIGTNNTVELFPILMWQAGGGIFSEDGSKSLLASDQSKQAVQYWANLIHTNHISPPGLSGADADKLVSAGTAAMEVNGPWATTGYKQAGIDYGLAPIPTGPNGQHISLGNTTVLAISSAASSAKAKAAAEFYAYWAQKDNQIKFTQGSGFPPVTTNVSAADLSANPDVAAFAGQSGSTRPLAPGQTKFATIQSDIFDPTIEKIISDPSKTSNLLDQAATQLTAMVGSN